MLYQLEKLGTSCESNRNQRWRNSFSEFCLCCGLLLWKKLFATDELELLYVCQGKLSTECFRLKKAPILCFPSDQGNATCSLRHLEVVLQKPRSKLFCEAVSMLVILMMFRSSFAGSVIRYERFFQSNMFETRSIYTWFGLVWTRSNKMPHQL